MLVSQTSHRTTRGTSTSLSISSAAPPELLLDFSSGRQGTDDGGGTTLLEHVTLDEIVGHGGYAQVWRGRWMKSKVGVKVFHAVSSPEAMRRVQAEAAILRTLRHPGVCYFFGTTLVEGGGMAIVMELLEGGTLGKYLGLDLYARDGQEGLPPSPPPPPPPSSEMEESGSARAAAGSSARARPCPTSIADVPRPLWRALPSDELLRLGRGVAAGLHYLHTQGVVHRDVKCSNVLMDAGRQPKLCDFGISALKSPVSPTRGQAALSSVSLGMPRYQAPEITERMAASADGVDLDASSLYVALDARTDTYAFGLVLYEILHGVIAFLGFPGIGAMLLALEGQRPLLELRHEHARLGDLVEACWHTDPAKRPSMERVIETLDEEAAGGAGAFPSPLTPDFL